VSPAQKKLYFIAWQAAARAHGWTSKAGLAAALTAHCAGQVWESPQLNESLATIYGLALFDAQRDGREVSADDLRHAITTFALGRHVSSKQFTNADFDKVFALLRLLANPTDLRNLLAVQDGGESGARRRQIFVIMRAPERYWQRIAADRFGHTDLDRLTLEQLRQLALTLRNRNPNHPARALQVA